MRSIINRIYVKSKSSTSNETDSEYHLCGVDYYDLQDMNIALQSAMNFEDLSILYFNTDARRYDLLFPCCLDAVKLYLNDSSDKTRVALETTIRGWEGYGSAGQALDPFIIRKLLSERSSPFNDLGLSYCEAEISTQPSKNDDPAHVCIQSLNVDSICGQIFGIKKDYGIDSVHFRKTSDPKVIEAVITQIKIS